MREKRCEDCLFWEAIKKGKEGFCQGFCHRYPPKTQGLLSDYYPRVDFDDWCGEWKPLAKPSETLNE